MVKPSSKREKSPLTILCVMVTVPKKKIKIKKKVEENHFNKHEGDWPAPGNGDEVFFF